MITLDKPSETRLIASFKRLSKKGSGFPPKRTLTDTLEKLCPEDDVPSINVNTKIADLFCSAAVESWQRAVHSFLISTALTEASPLWCSVTGYYSSHYSVRAFAHALGHFQLFKRKRLIALQLLSGNLTCTFSGKSGNDSEHKYYWTAVCRHPSFAGDDLFTENRLGDRVSDISHRGLANYADHVGGVPMFREAKKDAMRQRIERISEIEYTAASIPDRDKYPDVESVHIVAYHRLVRFRSLLDEVVGPVGYWKAHRNPVWAEDVMDFQLPGATNAGHAAAR